MGLGGISIWQLLIVLAIILLLVGPKRLKSLGSEMGISLKILGKQSTTKKKIRTKQINKIYLNV